ncbi:MAG: BatD family protein [Candidatus Omnitrophota bacterium]
MKKYIILITICLCAILSSSVCFAEEFSFNVTVDRTKVSLGRAVQLNLIFGGTQDISAPELPELEGFRSSYVGPSTSIAYVNGKSSSSITHKYLLVALNAGSFQIGPFTINYQGESYQSKPIIIEVVNGKVTYGNGAESKGEASIDDRVFLKVEPVKSNLYLNELLPIKFKLYIDNLVIRNIQFPEFSHDGFFVEEFTKPIQYQEILGGISYEVIEFKTNIFPTRTGDLALGPATLKCDLALERKRRGSSGFFDFDSFFDRYQTYPLNLSAPQKPITVRSLPEAGRPKGVKIAVGKFRMEVQAQPVEVKVGDPITLKVEIQGEGNFSTIKMPKLLSEDNFKIYEPQVTENGDVKIFEQVIMPTSTSVKEIPEIDFYYFNPDEGQYRLIKKGPFAVKVLDSGQPQRLQIVDSATKTTRILSEEALGRDIVYLKEDMGRLRKRGEYLYRNKVFFILQSLPLISVFLFLFLYKRRQKLKTDIGYARRLHAPKKAKKGINQALSFLKEAKTEEFYDSVYKTLREYLGDRFHTSIGGITLDFVDEVLQPKGVDEEILSALRGMFRDCDMARYAPSELNSESMQKTYDMLQYVIDKLESMR